MYHVGRKLALLIGLAVCCTVTQAVAQTPLLLAQAQPPAPKPYAIWMLECLGLMGLVSVLSGAAVFVGACLVVFLARRPAVIASYLPFLLLPLLFGALGALKGNISSFAVVAMAHVEIRQWQVFAGIAETLVLLMTALTVTLPSYVVVAIGLFVRTLAADGRPTTHGRTPARPDTA
jgi:hypothetical protein